MIVPKVYKSNKACTLIYLDKYFDLNILDEKRDANCAIIYNPCSEKLDEVIKKLREKELEIRIVVTPTDYNCLDTLKEKDFDMLNVYFDGDVKIKRKLLGFKNVEIYITEKSAAKAYLLLWNLKEFKKVFVPKSLEGKGQKSETTFDCGENDCIKEHENVKFF